MSNLPLHPKAGCSLNPVAALLAAVVLAVPAVAAAVEQVSREQDIVELRLGQRIQVNDGTCPTGQVKEVSGTTLTTAGVTRARKCVPRLGTPKK